MLHLQHRSPTVFPLPLSAGLEGVFDGLLSPKGRSRVFIEMLSRLVPVEVEADLLVRAV